MKNLIMIGMFLFITGCTMFQRPVQFVPVLTEIPIVHPKVVDPLTLENPTITAVNREKLSKILHEMTDVDVYYIMAPQSLQLLLNNDVTKLEYIQYETKRANFYRDYINEYNERVKTTK